MNTIAYLHHHTSSMSHNKPIVHSMKCINHPALERKLQELTYVFQVSRSGITSEFNDILVAIKESTTTKKVIIKSYEQRHPWLERNKQYLRGKEESSASSEIWKYRMCSELKHELCSFEEKKPRKII